MIYSFRIHKVCLLALFILFFVVNSHAQKGLYMGLTAGGGFNKTVVDRSLSAPEDHLQGQLGTTMPLGLFIGYNLTPYIGLQTGFRRTYQSFRIEANYPDHTFSASAGNFFTELPISLRLQHSISKHIGLFSQAGVAFTFFNGQELFNNRTRTASTEPWSTDRQIDMLTTTPLSYFGKAGINIRNFANKADLQLGISFHAINDNVMDGYFSHTGAEGKTEYYKFHGHGSYTAFEVSYVYHLETGLLNEKEAVPSRNSIYLEAGGAGGLYSVNYDRIFLVKRILKLGARAGLTFIPQSTASDLPDFGIPVTLNGLLFETKDHHIEVGLGQTLTTSNAIDLSIDQSSYDRSLTFSGNAFIGYRYQQNNGGFLFRAGYAPLWIDYQTFMHWAGISLGTTL